MLSIIDPQKTSIFAKTVSKDEIRSAFGKESGLSEIADREQSKMNARNWRKNDF